MPDQATSCPRRKVKISEDHWDPVRSNLDNYDREEYEHQLLLAVQVKSRPASAIATAPISGGSAYYIFKLGSARLSDPLITPHEARFAAKMPNIPKTSKGVGEDEEATSSRIDGIGKKSPWLRLINAGSAFQATFFRYSHAKKTPCESTAYSTVG